MSITHSKAPFGNVDVMLTWQSFPEEKEVKRNANSGTKLQASLRFLCPNAFTCSFLYSVTLGLLLRLSIKAKDVRGHPLASAATPLAPSPCSCR